MRTGAFRTSATSARQGPRGTSQEALITGKIHLALVGLQRSLATASHGRGLNKCQYRGHIFLI